MTISLTDPFTESFYRNGCRQSQQNQTLSCSALSPTGRRRHMKERVLSAIVTGCISLIYALSKGHSGLTRFKLTTLALCRDLLRQGILHRISQVWVTLAVLEVIKLPTAVGMLSLWKPTCGRDSLFMVMERLHTSQALLLNTHESHAKGCPVVVVQYWCHNVNSEFTNWDG